VPGDAIERLDYLRAGLIRRQRLRPCLRRERPRNRLIPGTFRLRRLGSILLRLLALYGCAARARIKIGRYKLA
jgi:hypothetical protein